MGTGLGLFICHGIVSSLGDEIQGESAIGHGATFRVLLPPSRSTVAPRSEPGTCPSGSSASSGRVLVVDDDAKVGHVFVTGGAFTPRTQTFLDAAPNERIEKKTSL